MKSMTIVFKSGAVVTVPYTAKVYAELRDNLGKDSIVENKKFKVATKNIEAVIFTQAAAEAEE